MKEIVDMLEQLRTLLEQLRDNTRFDNWVCFPGNTIEYVYDEDGVTLLEERLCRNNKVVIRRNYIYGDGRLVKVVVG